MPNRRGRRWCSCAVRAAGAVLLEGQDNGLGLAEAQLFNMFQRLHSHVEGSGAGLYLVRKIVESVGDNISVRSQLGEGFPFTVRLPG